MRRAWSVMLATLVVALVTPSIGRADVTFEFYTSRVAFENRLAGAVSVIDFDDVNTSLVDPVAFGAERYLGSHGAIIRGATSQGQYASRGFGDPTFAGSSSPNVYAPGPVSIVTGTNTTTWVTFFDTQEREGAVAGFGAVFIDADFPCCGPSSFTVFGVQDQQLFDSGTISGADGSKLFRGVVAVDEESDSPVRAIASVRLISGDEWPTVDVSEGVALDDFVFSSVPEPSSLMLHGAACLALAVTYRARVRKRHGRRA
jgi:hypothetical protein